MHEELGQLLAAMKLRIYGMCSLIPMDIPSLHENSQVTIGLIDQAIESMHSLVSALRPSVLLHGIAAALEWVVSEFNKQSDIVCELEIAEDDTFIGDELTTLVFRLVQESLEDTCLCAGTSRIVISWVSNQAGSSLTIQFDCQCCLDDSVSNKSLRLFGMQARVEAFGGTLRMSKIQGLGTLIEMHFPQCKTPDHQYMLPLD
jgi:signal transduction histidine kinase